MKISPVMLVLALMVTACDKGGFLDSTMKGGPGIDKKLGMIAPVPIKPAKTFTGQRHLGLEILSSGYDRTPYFVASPARTTLVLKPCQAVYLAGDRDATTPMQVNNFLLVEVAQEGTKHAVTLGNVETVRRNGRELPHIGPDSPVIPAGMPRLDKVIKPGIPAEITVTPLANQDVGGTSAIYLIVERADGKDAGNCHDGQAGFEADNTRKKPKSTSDSTPVFRTPEERARSFKTMTPDMIPGARPPLSNGDTPSQPMPATPVEAMVLPSSKGIPEKGVPAKTTQQAPKGAPSPDQALEERIRNFRSTPEPEPGTLAARNRARKQQQTGTEKPVSAPATPPQPSTKPAAAKLIPTSSTQTPKPDDKPPAPKYILKKPDQAQMPKIQPAPRVAVEKMAVEKDVPLKPSESGQILRTGEAIKQSGQPALGSKVSAGKIITRKDKDGKITKTFVPAESEPTPEQKTGQ